MLTSSFSISYRELNSFLTKIFKFWSIEGCDIRICLF